MLSKRMECILEKEGYWHNFFSAEVYKFWCSDYRYAERLVNHLYQELKDQWAAA